MGNIDIQKVLQKLAESFESENLDTRDGIKLIREYGWCHLRASNTEPILRCYAEGKTMEHANELISVMKKNLTAATKHQTDYELPIQHHGDS